MVILFLFIVKLVKLVPNSHGNVNVIFLINQAFERLLRQNLRSQGFWERLGTWKRESC